MCGTTRPRPRRRWRDDGPHVASLLPLQGALAASGQLLARREQSTGLFASRLGPEGALGRLGAARRRPMSRILVVEDELAIAELVAINLRHAGHEVAVAADAEQAVAEVDAVLPDLVVLDWMLPGQSVLALARRWRGDARTQALPVIMLTARGEESDKVAGLDAGADDYLTKPFSTQELM